MILVLALQTRFGCYWSEYRVEGGKGGGALRRAAANCCHIDGMYFPSLALDVCGS